MSFSRKIKFLLTFGFLFISPVFAQTGDIQNPNAQIDSLVKDRMNIFVQDNSGILLESVSKKEELINLKKEILEQGQKKVDWWLTALGIIITLATVLFVYDAIAIKSSLKEVKEEAKLKIEELESEAESKIKEFENEVKLKISDLEAVSINERDALKEIYKQEKNELFEKQKILEQAIDFSIEFSRAMSLLGARRYDIASGLFYGLLSGKSLTRAQKALCFKHIGILFGEQKKYEEALVNFSKALEFEPNDISTICNKVKSFKHLNRFKEALELIEEGLRIDSDNKDLLKQKESVIETGKEFLKKTKRRKTVQKIAN